MKVHQMILYFFLTVVLLSSIGVWLPYAIDLFVSNDVSAETAKAFSGNLMTYYIAIFIVGVIDRILSILSNPNYSFKKTEFLFLVAGSMACIVITFFAFKNIFHKEYERANIYAWIGTVMSFIIWWISKADSIEKFQPNILGDPIN
jgi:hypothetical protein